jgi:hypothetical protein
MLYLMLTIRVSIGFQTLSLKLFGECMCIIDASLVSAWIDILGVFVCPGFFAIV